MFRLYQRNGLYRRACAEFRHATEPPAKDETNTNWNDTKAMEKLPDIAVRSQREGTIAYKKWTNEMYV